MDSYARYRMTDWNWIAIYKEKMGVDLFREYVNGVYNELLNMKVDCSFSLEATVKEENRELFIKIVCMFIQEGNYDYDFSQDYKFIRRHEKTTLVRKPRKNIEGESGEDNSQRNREDSRKDRVSR